jgi:hypothetical protein
MGCWKVNSLLLSTLCVLTFFLSCVSSADQKEENVCPYCLESLKNGQKLTSYPCNHFCHKVCEKSWVEKDDSCPTCRRIISKAKLDDLMKKFQKTLQIFNYMQSIFIPYNLIKQNFATQFMKLPAIPYVSGCLNYQLWISYGLLSYIFVTHYNIHTILTKVFNVEGTFFKQVWILYIFQYLGILFTFSLKLNYFENILFYISVVMLIKESLETIFKAMCTILQPLPNYK